MGLFRIQHTDFEQTFNIAQYEAASASEWENTNRVIEPAWEERYNTIRQKPPWTYYTIVIIVNIAKSWFKL